MNRKRIYSVHADIAQVAENIDASKPPKWYTTISIFRQNKDGEIFIHTYYGHGHKTVKRRMDHLTRGRKLQDALLAKQLEAKPNDKSRINHSRKHR